MNLLGWVVVIVMVCGCLYGIYNIVRLDNFVYFLKEVMVLYNGVSCIVWGVVVCWVIFVCFIGNGGK